MTGTVRDTTTGCDSQQSQVEAPSGNSINCRVVRPSVSQVGRNTGAGTPEDLETMFEDALLIGNEEVLAQLFDEEAALVMDAELPVRGGEQIARLALTTWKGSRAYVADPHCVVQAGDIALVLVEQGINVVRCGRDGTWRYVIQVLSTHVVTTIGGTNDSK